MNRATKTKNRTTFFFFMLGLAILLPILAAEIILRTTNLEFEFLKYTLFYSSADSEFYVNSQNPKLLYSPKPNVRAVTEAGLHPLETKYTKREVSINSFGFRSPEWKKEKSSGIFRIFIFGNSNTFGVSVSNQDAYPQVLNALLGDLYPGKFEVWNGGITASVLSQVVEYARYAASNFSPDLIIIQDFVNFGRRPFLNKETQIPNLEDSHIPKYFRENPELYAENIPLLISDIVYLEKIHNHLVQKFAVYRFIHILINNYYVKLSYPHHQLWDCNEDRKKCDWISQKFSRYGELVNKREFNQFKKDFPNIPVILMDPITSRFCAPGNYTFLGVPVFSICAKNLAEEYHHVHPPSKVYKFYGREILKYLQQNSFLKIPDESVGRLRQTTKIPKQK